MFDRVYIGQEVLGDFSAQPAFEDWSRVELMVDDNTAYYAGTETGRTLTLTIPFGTQAMAEAILKRIKGRNYRPYSAGDAILNPAAELGDAAEVRDAYGGIYSRERTFGKLYTASISAPGDEEIDHEYPYQSSKDRVVTRRLKETSATLSILSDRITAEVLAREADGRELHSALEIQADQISAKVSRTGGDSASFGWDLSPDSWTIRSGGGTVLLANDDGLTVSGKIVATSGRIGPLDITQDRLSYNGQVWGGTNTWGCYIGPSGLQLGKNFKVDMAGNLSAASGHFSGSVNAGNINYGGDAGHLWGDAISSGSISGGSGGQIANATITTANTGWGINTSLGNADFAADCVRGYRSFGNMIGTYLSASRISLGGYSLGRTDITYKDGNGKTKHLNVVTWTS